MDRVITEKDRMVDTKGVSRFFRMVPHYETRAAVTINIVEVVKENFAPRDQERGIKTLLSG